MVKVRRFKLGMQACITNTRPYRRKESVHGHHDTTSKRVTGGATVAIA